MRFLAASQDTGLTSAAVWATRLFKAVEPALVAQWRSLLEAFPVVAMKYAGILQEDPKQWFIHNTQQLVDMVTAYSHNGMPEQSFDAGHGFAAFDVEQLYVMIGLGDLGRTSHSSLQTGWQWYAAVQPDTLPSDPPAGAQQAPMEVDCTGWLVVYANKAEPAVFIPGNEESLRQRLGVRNPQRNQGSGMWNDHLGKDPVKGDYCVFSSEVACELVGLIINNSNVRFGPQVYRQTTGIPKGVNPGLYLANFYLYDYEFQFFRQFYDLLYQFPPGLSAVDRRCPNPVLTQLLECQDREWLLQLATQPANRRLIGDAVLSVFANFQFVVRFVDDVITGPNQYITQLVHVNDTLLGGLIKGIYPTYLNLKESEPAAEATGSHWETHGMRLYV
jgi:hypothetical protein